MIDITNKMFDFKEAIRHIWNTYFATSVSPMSPEIQDAFSSIERALLRVLVLGPHGLGDLADSYRLRVFENILIMPARSLIEMPVRFGHNDPNGNILWEMKTMLGIEPNTRLGFYDFFDWDPYGRVDLPFVRVRELPSTDRNSKGGRIALIEQIHCQFMLELRGSESI